jgi:hypothetical protein
MLGIKPKNKFLIYGRGDTIVIKKLELPNLKKESTDIFKMMDKKGLKISDEEIQKKYPQLARPIDDSTLRVVLDTNVLVNAKKINYWRSSLFSCFFRYTNKKTLIPATTTITAATTIAALVEKISFF